MSRGAGRGDRASLRREADKLAITEVSRMCHYDASVTSDDDAAADHYYFSNSSVASLCTSSAIWGQRMGCQVLLVESDLQTSTAITKVLGEAGHAVTALTSFEAATAAASNRVPTW